MSQTVREEMLPRLRQRYVNRGRQGRSRMIDELCEQFGYSRKHAIKLLGARSGWGGDPKVRKGRPPKYGQEVAEVLWRIWKAAEQPCGKRLVAMLSLWLPHYETEHGRLPAKVRQQLRSISAAQADRLLAPRKARCQHRGRSGTKPGSLLKHHISSAAPRRSPLRGSLRLAVSLRSAPSAPTTGTSASPAGWRQTPSPTAAPRWRAS